MMVKGIMLAALVAMPVAGFAADTNVVWKSSLGLGATYKSGNTEKSLFTMNLKGDRSAPRTDWINSLYGEYGKTEGDQTEGQLRGQSDYRWKLGNDSKWYAAAFGEIYNDALKDINYRVKLGPNVGYYFIKNDKMKLDANAGINYVRESTAVEDKDYAEYRAAANYFWQISATAEYYLNVEYSADVEDIDNGNGLFVTGVKSKVNNKLALFVELRDEYDNMPDGPDVVYNDVTIIAGLSYDF
jgi:hypothetical protein